MKHFGKQVGVASRECSKCGGDLGERYGKQRYCKSCHALHMRNNRPKHRDLPDEARLKANVRRMTSYYVKRGLIKKTDCANCGNIRSEAHHTDYTKPLEVIWLCRPCHLKIHNDTI